MATPTPTFFANIAHHNGTDYDLQADTLAELAAALPEDWRGTARARDAHGSVVGYIGRDLFTGATYWKAI